MGVANNKVCVETRSIRLFKREASSGPTSYFAHPPICTVTFFGAGAGAGSSSSIVEDATNHFRTRLRLMLDQNPWVGGSLRRENGRVRLACPRSANEVSVDSILRIEPTPIPGLTTSTPYEDLVASCATLSVGEHGSEQLKRGEPVTKCVIAPLLFSPSDDHEDGDDRESEGGGGGGDSGDSNDRVGGFAVVFSMSHVVADGRTYYSVLHMLSDRDDNLVRKLNPERKTEYEDVQEKKLMGAKDWKFGNSLAFIKAMISGTLSKPKGRVLAYHVDRTRIDSIKNDAAANGSVDYVTSNDVITSHFMNACGARIGMMAVDHRNVWTALDGSSAGNYVGCVLSDPGGYATPADVRKWSTPHAPEGYLSGITKEYPGLCGACPVAFMSSWVFPEHSFDLNLEGTVSQRLHLPIYMAPVARTPTDVAIVFNPQPGRLAVLYIAKHGGRDELLNPSTTILSEPLDKKMFPLA